MNTQELVERLREDAKLLLIENLSIDGLKAKEEFLELIPTNLRAAASRLSEMDAEMKRLREAIFWACGAVGDFPGSGDPSRGKFFWRKELRERAGITGEELNARAALEQQQKGEKL